MRTLYIARRLVRFASEDWSGRYQRAQRDHQRFSSLSVSGMPECDVHLTEAVTHLSLAQVQRHLQGPQAAKKDVKEKRDEPVPPRFAMHRPS